VADETVKDPLGRSITLHNHTWYGHIIRHHPDLRLHRALVVATITQPLEIRFHPDDADSRFYFGAGPRRGIMMLVVVDVVQGLVKTAHLIKTTKGALEWSPPTP